MYEYRVANVAKVVDGDTFDFDLDLGFYAFLRVRVRLKDIDTYEIYGVNAHSLGSEARDFAEQWMYEAMEDGGLFIRTFKLTPDTPVADGAFGRWLGEVYNVDDELLAAALREAGYEDTEE